MTMTEPDVTGEEDAPIGSEDFARAAGITYRQLQNWTELGHIRPVDPHPGTGYAREWPDAELEIARRMGRLTAAGLPLAFAAEMARETWPAGELAEGIRIVVTDTEETT